MSSRTQVTTYVSDSIACGPDRALLPKVPPRILFASLESTTLRCTSPTPSQVAGTANRKDRSVLGLRLREVRWSSPTGIPSPSRSLGPGPKSPIWLRPALLGESYRKPPPRAPVWLCSPAEDVPAFSPYRLSTSSFLPSATVSSSARLKSGVERRVSRPVSVPTRDFSVSPATW
ncbi:hypothetical protein APS67_005790 [Streptomyces sp. AVP053U2]|nr:hypothetical protein APS67_005790 [Streptomyces sp. AVP053U2]